MKQSVELGGVTADTSPGTRIALVDDRGVVHITHTRSEAWQVESGHWLVQIVGRTGGYLCARCFALPDEAIQGAEGLEG
ncbi:MAG TPA: hypothetical protein VK571_06400 [Gemmatimonadaceae bacterium]|nr:hypothetical protein [Gemmatimonadaceae bacterium]